MGPVGQPGRGGRQELSAVLKEAAKPLVQPGVRGLALSVVLKEAAKSLGASLLPAPLLVLFSSSLWGVPRCLSSISSLHLPLFP